MSQSILTLLQLAIDMIVHSGEYSLENLSESFLFQRVVQVSSNSEGHEWVSLSWRALCESVEGMVAHFGGDEYVSLS